MTDPTGLGVRLRQARERAGFSQQEIADTLGIAREIVSYWETERRTPGLALLSRLAEAYGVTVGSLLNDTAEAVLTAEEHDLVYRDLGRQKGQTRVAIRRWLAFLDEWATLLDACGTALPGRAVPPNRAWRAARPITDSRLAPGLAAAARTFYGFGSDAIPDLFAFLDRQGVLVYRAALDPIGDGEGISGVFYNHPRLGFCILVNTATTPGRQTFTLAHEFAHALFHYQEHGLVSRTNDPDRKERFADAFAAHFLVPGVALRARVTQSPLGAVVGPLDVLSLQRYFRVSYATMLVRLRSEGLLSPEQYAEYRTYSPSRLAARLGLDCEDYYPSASATVTSLASYPPSVLARTRALIESGDLSPAGAADLLQLSQEEVLGELLSPPEQAVDIERQEFEELPAPVVGRARR